MKNLLPKTRLLLIGGGLTHVCFLSKLSWREMEEMEIFLVAPPFSLYCLEMAAGYLEGIFSEENVQINIAKICERKGVHLITTQPVKIESANKRIVMEGGQRISYDILSLNLESLGRYVEGLAHYGMAIRLDDNLRKLKHHFQKKGFETNITIVGAGKLGVEIALALRFLADTNKQTMNITLIEGTQTLLPGYDIKMKKIVQDRLRKKRIDLLLGRNVMRVTGDLLVFNDNSVLEYGFLIWAAIALHYPVLEGSDILVDERGRIIVDSDLRVKGQTMIFACGESAVIQDSIRPLLTIDPSKEAEILLINIIRASKSRPLLPCVSLETAKGSIYLGEQRAVTQNNGSVSKGVWEWHTRKSHDQKLVRKLQIP